MPSPPIIQEIITKEMDEDSACIIADTTNKEAAKSKMLFLPNRSLSFPEASTPTAPPSSRLDTTKPTIVGLRLKCTFINPIAPEMTAVS